MSTRHFHESAPMARMIHSYNVAVPDRATGMTDQAVMRLLDDLPPDQQRMEELRFPVERPDFKSGRGCQQSLVGSTPTLFRHPLFLHPPSPGIR